jgi:hypothetical protein
MALIYDGGLPHSALKPGDRVAVRISGNALEVKKDIVGIPYYILLSSLIDIEQPSPERLLIHWVSVLGSHMTLRLREDVKRNQEPRDVAKLRDQLTPHIRRRFEPDLLTSDFRPLFLKWLRGLYDLRCRNEVEVEVKVISPLVQFLGYELHQVHLRVPVRVQVGRQQVEGEADWVLDRADGSGPLVVIEAKAPSEQLDESVRAQARSYAFALLAPYYLLVNGRVLEVYELRTTGDEKLLSCPLTEVGTHWSTLERIIGHNKQPQENGTTDSSSEQGSLSEQASDQSLPSAPGGGTPPLSNSASSLDRPRSGALQHRVLAVLLGGLLALTVALTALCATCKGLWTPTPTPTLLLERQVVVPPKESHEIRFDIDRDSMLACTITVSGGNNDIDIRILDADRQPILYEPRLAGTNTVRVSIPGGQQYWLVLDNSFSSRTQKRVQVRCVATPP